MVGEEVDDPAPRPDGQVVAEALGLKGRTGVRVTRVHPDSTASKAGLQVGDVLLTLDGEAIPASRVEELEILPALIRQYRVGTTVTLGGVRDGKPLSVAVELAASPQSTRELAEYRDPTFEFSARDLSFLERVDDPAGRGGAVISRVETGGWGALARLSVGDVVLSVDGRAVSTAAALADHMKRVHSGQRVVLLVRRGIHTLFVELEPA